MRAFARRCLRSGVQHLQAQQLAPSGAPTAGARLAVSTTAAQGPERSYPQEPRVGVGVVVFRRPPAPGLAPDLLLIKRGKEPNLNQWCFPGGSLELGETLAECAVREVAEETGITLQNLTGVDMVEDEEGFSDELLVPTAFAAVDSIVMPDGSEGRATTSGAPATKGPPRFHYAIIEVAALVSHHHLRKAPQPLDDALDAMWLPTDRLRSLPNLVPMCARMTEEALRRFPIVLQPLQHYSTTTAATASAVQQPPVVQSTTLPQRSQQQQAYGGGAGPP